MCYEHQHWEHGVVVAAVAPTEYVNAVVADVGKGWRDRIVFVHPISVRVIRPKEEAPLKVKPNGMSAFGCNADMAATWPESPLVANTGHSTSAKQCPHYTIKRTSFRAMGMPIEFEC
jgi:hypothetical protein